LQDTLYEMVKKAQNGDQKTLEHLLRLVEPKVTYAASKVPVQEREDVKQELFLHLMEMIQRYDTEKVPTLSEYIEMKKQRTKDNC